MALNQTLYDKEGVYLNNRSAWPSLQTPYFYGAYFLAPLDEEIRAETGSDRTLENVF